VEGFYYAKRKVSYGITQLIQYPFLSLVPATILYMLLAYFAFKVLDLPMNQEIRTIVVIAHWKMK